MQKDALMTAGDLNRDGRGDPLSSAASSAEVDNFGVTLRLAAAGQAREKNQTARTNHTLAKPDNVKVSLAAPHGFCDLVGLAPRRRPSSMEVCPAGCGFKGLKLKTHYYFSPNCKPAATAVPQKQKRKVRDPLASATLFFNRVQGEIGAWFLHAHIDKYQSLSELDNTRGLLRICTTLLTDFIEQELCLDGHPATPKIFQSARCAFDALPNMSTLMRQRMQLFARAVPRHLGNSKTDKKGAAFFDCYTVLSVMLQESAAVRKLVIAASEEWKTGALYKTRPPILSDLTHGTRFLDWQAVCGKATESEAKDLRLVLHLWTDEFTPIDGLSQKARHHKYGALLAALVNLPHRMRHYADHILLLALYNSRCA